MLCHNTIRRRLVAGGFVETASGHPWRHGPTLRSATWHRLRHRFLATNCAGIKIHETRIIRLLEVLLHAGNNLGGWSAMHIHQVILRSFQLSEKAYGLNQLRYDLRKLKLVFNTLKT
jgi:hypothetical protein